MPSRFLFLVLCLGVFSFYGCGDSSAPKLHYKSSDEVMHLSAKRKAEIETILTKLFGTPTSPEIPADSGLNADLVKKAPALYRYNCIHCHGTTGDGNGPTARFLYPRPRDFRQGMFKFTSTSSDPADTKPVREDLQRTLKNGVNFTAMPSFVLLPQEERDALVEYVMLLSMRGEVEGLLAVSSEDYDEKESYPDDFIKEQTDRVFAKWKAAKDMVVVPPAPTVASSPESIARGKALFLVRCASCHGPEGQGAAVQGQTDFWKFPTQAADLTRGIYHGGGRPVDLYRRVHSGIKGSPMPRSGRLNEAETDKLTSEEIWDLVHFVQSLNKNRL